MSITKSKFAELMGRGLDFLPYLMAITIAIGLIVDIDHGKWAWAMLTLPVIAAIVLAAIDLRLN